MFQSILLLLGRIFISALFLWAGVAKIMDINGTLQLMSTRHLPMTPLLLAGAITFQILGGLSLLTGFKAKWGALALIFFTIPASTLFHDFWNQQGHDRIVEQLLFMKDFAVVGGLLGFAAFGPGRYRLYSHSKDEIYS